LTKGGRKRRRADPHGDASFTERGSPGDQESEQVHGVLPADLSVVAQVLLDLLELGHPVAVEGLVDHTRRYTLWKAAWSVGLITISSMHTWAGREAIQTMASATSCAWSGWTPA